MTFLADLVFSVWKLFPATYNCQSLACAKLVHNCCMTLCGVPFALMDECISGEKDLNQMPEGYLNTTRVKVAEIVVSLGYLVYDAAREEITGPGTRNLLIVTCCAEILLMLPGLFYVMKLHKRLHRVVFKPGE